MTNPKQIQFEEECSRAVLMHFGPSPIDYKLFVYADNCAQNHTQRANARYPGKAWPKRSWYPLTHLLPHQRQ